MDARDREKKMKRYVNVCKMNARDRWGKRCGGGRFSTIKQKEKMNNPTGQIVFLECSVAKWFVRWAVVRQSPGFDSRPATLPRPSRKKIICPDAGSHLPSSGRKNTQQNIPRKNNV
jgi:hypothetical protein